MDIVTRVNNIPLPPLGTPGPFGLADQKLLCRSIEKAGLRDIKIEKVNVTFNFNAAEDYTKVSQDTSALVKAILKNQSKERTEQIWNIIPQKVSENTTTKDDNRD